MSRKDAIIQEIDYLTNELESCEHYDIGFPVNNMPALEWKAWVSSSLERQEKMLVELNRREKEQRENEK